MVGWHHRLTGHELGQTEIVRDREAWHSAVHGPRGERHGAICSYQSGKGNRSYCSAQGSMGLKPVLVPVPASKINF